MTNTTPIAAKFSRTTLGWRVLLALLLTASCGETDSGGLTGPAPTGALELSLSGLPAGVAGRLIVIGPNRIDTLTSSRMLSGLTPGQYQIAAQDVDADDVTLLASPAFQTIAVSGGGTVSAHVDYHPGAPRSGSLTISVEGLPAGANGAIAVSGPSGFYQNVTTTTSAAGLIAGSYLIAANPVTVDGATYAAEPVSQSVVVVTAEMRTGVVQYHRVAATTGALSITSSGLPAGAMAAITVSGPNGFAATLTASSQLENLTPGSYIVAASEVAVEGARHDPTPASQVITVTGGDVAAVAVTYAPPSTQVTGGLSLQVTGLGGGALAAIAVSGPNGYARLVSATSVLEGLAPGSYTVNSVAVLVNGISHTPSPSSQSVTIVAGATATASVAYSVPSPNLGQLRVNIAGLPIPAAAAITVTGPDGSPFQVTTTTTIDGLTPGSYTVAASPVTVTGVNYLAGPVSQVAIVVAGTTTAVSVLYVAPTPGMGQLGIEISGLPGVAAAITVTGPNGYSRLVTTSATINALPIGGYTVTAGAVTVGGVSYLPTPSTQAAAITAGVRTVSAITYAVSNPTTGGLSLTVSGVPAPAAAAIIVTGPDGFSRAVPATTTLTGLAPGSYTVTATPVVLSGTSYLPAPTSQVVTVTAGATSTGAVVYTVAAPTTGQLTVSIGGLPGGAAAAITVTGPNSYSHAVTANETITGLLPGSYTVAATPVVVSGVTYVATPASQAATITAGGSSSRTITYAVQAPTTGQLTVTVSGLPGGTAAAIAVTGPNSYSHAVTANETITGLLPGSYTVAATPVVVSGVTYLATPASQAATITAGGSSSRTITYAVQAPTAGQLTVTVSGLPGGANSVITVTGPNSYSHSVTATETITALTPGTYTITSSTVTAGGTSYTPAPNSQSATVTAGVTATRAVVYTTVAGPATITVDTSARFQQMVGWEATAQAGQGTAQFDGYQSELMDLAANDLGVNRIRIEIASGAENTVDYYAQYRAGTITSTQYNAQRYAWVNDNGDPNTINPAGFKWSKLDEGVEATILPLRSRLAARGEALYVNLNYVSFGGSTAQQSAAEYAELILATFQHMQSRYGFVPDAVEIILEPDNNTIRTGAGIGGLIATTGARLAAAGFHPDFIAPSVMNMGNAVTYLNGIAGVSGALTYLTDVAYHRYSGVSDANLNAIRTRAAQLGLRTSMLEHIGSGVEDLYKDLTLANVSAWQQYTLAYPTSDNGAQYYYISGGRPVAGSRTHALRQYFRYVRAGAYRVAATSLNSSVRPVAFVNPGASMAVVLHIDAPGTYSVGGLRPGSYQVEMTNGAGTLVSMGSVTSVAGGSVTISPTQTGVLTLYRGP
ncbi:MAG: hypothetical protein IPG05_13705 [Gemmatimonadetes bacterium]|nr:hypothetical protein [Gemmatimonadota bacterium]